MEDSWGIQVHRFLNKLTAGFYRLRLGVGHRKLVYMIGIALGGKTSVSIYIPIPYQKELDFVLDVCVACQCSTLNRDPGSLETLKDMDSC